MTAWLAMVFGPPRLYPPLPGWLLAAIHGVEWALAVFTLYATVIPLGGFRTPVRRRLSPPRCSFAVVIPAHNERRVVGNLVDSCFALDYPRRLFEVFVVADNCSDDTAAVARARGARVIRRSDPLRRGKGYALEYAFQRILSGPRRFDAVVVLDADNLVRPDFLRVMNTELLSGRRIVQARMDVKNPDDTWVTATFGMSVWVSNRFWYMAKYNLGFSAVLGGTGMCIATDVLREIGWGATSLTEDLEFTMKALVRGIRTAWAHDAVVYDEKPLTFRQSWRQRLRWVQGQVTVAAQYLPQLLWAAVVRRDLLCLEGAFQLLQPFYVMLTSLLIVVSFLPGRDFLLDPVLAHVLWSRLWGAVYLVQYALPLVAAALDRQPGRALRYLPLYPLFQYSWIPLTWVGLFSFRQRTWTHTEHTRAIGIQELLGTRGSG